MIRRRGRQAPLVLCGDHFVDSECRERRVKARHSTSRAEKGAGAGCKLRLTIEGALGVSSIEVVD